MLFTLYNIIQEKGIWEFVMLSFAVISQDTDIIDYIQCYLESECANQMIPLYVFPNFYCFLTEANFRKINVLIIDTDLECWKENTVRIYKDFPYMNIIFVGSNLEVGYKVYDIRHFAFIYKKELIPYFPDALSRLKSELKIKDKNTIRISWKNVVYVLYEQDIIYFERDKRKTMVHMMDGTEYTTYKHIDEFEKTVSDDFMRIHFSYLVNLQYVKEYHRNHLFLSDDSFVPISRKYEKGVKEYFEK